MFGLSKLFQALRRFTKAVDASADLWEAANAELKQRLAIDDSGIELPCDAKRNGHKRLAKEV